MAELSKTAKAAMKAGAEKTGPKKTISDAEHVRLLRIDLASQIYPGIEGTRALLRLYDDNADLLLAVKALAIQVAELGETNLELDQTATALEASRDAAEASVQDLLDQIAALEQHHKLTDAQAAE